VRKRTITAAEVLLAVKIQNAGKAAGCNDIRPDMLKFFKIKGVLCLDVCVLSSLMLWKGTE